MAAIEGSLEVFKNFWRKYALLQRGECAERFRLMVVAGDGVLLGVRTGGALAALDQVDLLGVMDIAVGISTGIPMMAYGLAGQATIGQSIYENECTGSAFFDARRRECPKMDVEWLRSVFQGNVISEKALSQDAVRKHGAEFHAVLRNMESDALELFEQPHTNVSAATKSRLLTSVILTYRTSIRSSKPLVRSL